MLWGGCLLAVPLLFLLSGYLFPLPDKVEYSPVVTDRKGTVIHTWLTSDQQWRMKTELQEISPLLQKAIVEKEDRWFYYHFGINPLAIGRALSNNIFSGRRTSGASTITMQVARALEPRKRTYTAKVIEMFRALQLEWKYSKKEILQFYLNLVPYGGNIQGVKSASVLYFRKNPDHLSLAEVVALSVIPNRPSTLVIGRNNEAVTRERNKWLERFRRASVFPERDIMDALAEPLTARRMAAPKLVPHLAQKLRKSGRATLTSPIDLNMQLKTEKLVADYVRGLRLNRVYQSAVIIIDNRTSEVVSYIGSADFADSIDAGQVNGASAIRQPGSTLKPLLYGMCVDAGLMTPKTILTDLAVNYDGYAPENFDRKQNGHVTMEYALELSLNIPAVKGLRALGKDRFIRQLSDIGFRQVSRDRQKLGLSLILGGCGATLEELTALYSSFAREGFFSTPMYMRSERPADRKRILSPAATFMINEILSKVNRPDFPLSWGSTEKMPTIAWKTGTSYGRRDAWSIGYNKHFTVGVWVGNFSGIGSPLISGAEIATPLLFRIFNTIDYDTGRDWFEQPATCGIRKVCPVTGLVPGEYCDNQVSDLYIPLVSSTRKCNHIREVFTDARETISYCMNCRPASGYRKALYPDIPADMREWMDQQQIAYKKQPAHNPDCETILREGAPLILSPSANAEYLVDGKNPEPLLLSCNPGPDAGRVFWFINDRFYKSAQAREKVFFMPEPGPVKISCSDDRGRNRDIWIRVKFTGQ